MRKNPDLWVLVGWSQAGSRSSQLILALLTAPDAIAKGEALAIFSGQGSRSSQWILALLTASDAIAKVKTLAIFL